MDFLKSHISVWEILATQFTIDRKTINSMKKRADSESFFYHDLPKLGKAVTAGLESGRLDLTDVPFKRKSKKDMRPSFMHELIEQVYDKDGYVLPSPKKISEIRQLTMMFYKFVKTPTADQVRLANLKFVITDCQVKTDNWPDSINEVKKHFESLLPGMPCDIRPHHSSGATFDGSDNYERMIRRKPFFDLYRYFGLDSFFLSEAGAEALLQESPVTQVSRVSHVPKDSRGSRVICIEDHTPMMAQKGLQQLLYDFIEGESPASGFINFTDQSINRRLAQLGSVDGSYATIDLKDASDLVSNSLIEELATPEWRGALKCTRSTHAFVDGYYRPLKKFAPMGSALCFPIEAMLFWSICKTVSDVVYVYGDDIIVPVDHASRVITELESYGLKVNHAKTLTRGFFRESCGGDYYRGAPINYINLKSYDLANYVAFLNNMSDCYGAQVSDALLHEYEARMNVVVFREHVSLRERPRELVYYTEFTSSTDAFFKRRWNPDLHRHEVMSLIVTSRGNRRESVGDIDDDFLYLTWLANNIPTNQPIDYHINREYTPLVLTPRQSKRKNLELYTSLMSRDISRQVANPVVKFAWVPMG